MRLLKKITCQNPMSFLPWLFVCLSFMVCLARAHATPNFSIAVLPDTQNYSKDDPDKYYDQADSIIDNAYYYNTKFVIHLGDMVDDSYYQTRWDESCYPSYYTYYNEQYEVASEAQDLIDAYIPWSPCLGNHDYAGEWDDRNAGVFNLGSITSYYCQSNYFGSSRFSGKSWYGGQMESEHNENSYYYFSVGSLKFMVLVLECSPRQNVIDWANGIVAANSDKRVIVVTHAYLQPSSFGTLAYAGSAISNGHSGQELWDDLIKQHFNIFMVVCGHINGDNVRKKTGVYGNAIYEVLIDYQDDYNGGNGWYKRFTFVPSENMIYMYPVRAYGNTTFKLSSIYSTTILEYEEILDYDEPPNMGATDGGHKYKMYYDMSDKLYAFYSDSNTVKKYENDAWTTIKSDWAVTSMAASATTLYADFTGYGLYKYENSAWTSINSAHPTVMAASATTLYAYFTGYGLYKYENSAWTWIGSSQPTIMSTSGTALYAFFPDGDYVLKKYENNTWTDISGAWVNSMAASASTLYVDFYAWGLYKYENSTWTQINSAHPSVMMASGRTLYAFFPDGDYVLKKYENNTWTDINGAWVNSMAASASMLYVDFYAWGLYKYENSAWTQINSAHPNAMAARHFPY